MISIWHIPMRPHPADSYPTSTSIEQLETEQTLLRNLTTKPPSPPTILNKTLHAQYLAKNLMALPAPYVSLDASRPWLMYWCLHSFDLLGIALDPETKSKASRTLLSFQSPSGGFCGGPPPAHEAHLLPTYAAIMGLAICGNLEDWERIDRKGCYEFFMRCKRPDGGFVVSSNGEVDVRGIYCLLTISTLLDILTPELVLGVDDFLAGCQTYEGGFASSSFSSGGFGSHVGGGDGGCGMVPMAEAHGGYTSCALNSYFLLRPLYPTARSISKGRKPTSIAPNANNIHPSLDSSPPCSSRSRALTPTLHPIDLPSALRWTTTMQAGSIEGGGFRGRTNKLVDGCYGWWVGGLGAVLDALIRVYAEEEDEDRDEDGLGLGQAGGLDDGHHDDMRSGEDGHEDGETATLAGDQESSVEDGSTDHEEEEEGWQDQIEEPDMLINRVALQEYILLAAQGEKGGLRDKPGKNADLYHTTNNLSGLSTAQHLVRHSPSRVRLAKSQWRPSCAPDWLIESQRAARALIGMEPESEDWRDARRRDVWADALGWAEHEEGFFAVGGDVNRVNTTSPVFNILLLRVKPFIDHFYGQA